MIQLRLLGVTALAAADGSEIRAVLTQPKRLALLAYLVMAPGGFRSRDTILGLFWPESPERQARLALRQALHHLRRALGPDVVVNRGRTEIGLSAGALRCDVSQFRDAMAHGDYASALEAYRGSLLEGFACAEMSSALEQWIEAERADLRRMAACAAAALADAAEASASWPLAAARAREALWLDPDSEPALRRALRLMNRAGERPAALRLAHDVSRRMRDDLGLDLSSETQSLLAELRTVPPTGEVVPPPPGPPSSLAGRPPARRRLPRLTASMVGAALVALLAWTRFDATDRQPRDAPAALARNLYTEGVRARSRLGDRQALPFFLAALRKDSTCAMCAYYAASGEGVLDPVAALNDFRRAVQLSASAAPRDRWRIRQAWNRFAGVGTPKVSIDSLLTVHPDDPEGLLAKGTYLLNTGRFLEAMPFLHRAVVADSANLNDGGSACVACSAQHAIVTGYWLADSLPAAERYARQLTEERPDRQAPWQLLAETWRRMGQYDLAGAADSQAAQLGPSGGQARFPQARTDIRRGDFAAADARLRAAVETGRLQWREDAAWFLIISLRNQGRLTEALALARKYRGPNIAEDTLGKHAAERAAVAQILFELGRWHESAAAFQAMASVRPPGLEDLPGVWARARAWALTHEAEALAAAGDTTAVLALVDTVRRVGQASSYGRDRLLYHHLLGLVAEARGDRRTAESEFRAAIYSMTEGYTRSNLHLARILLDEQRPQEAVAVLEPALRGPLDASNFYVTRTELHAVLSRALQESGAPERAAMHGHLAAAAWERADPLVSEPGSGNGVPAGHGGRRVAVAVSGG